MRHRVLDSISLTTWLLAALAGHVYDEIKFRRIQRQARRMYGRA